MPVKLATLMVVDLYWNVAIIKVHKLYRDTQQQVQTRSLRQRFQCSQLWNFVKAKKIKYVNMHFVMAKKLLKNGYFLHFFWLKNQTWVGNTVRLRPPSFPFLLPPHSFSSEHQKEYLGAYIAISRTFRALIWQWWKKQVPWHYLIMNLFSLGFLILQKIAQYRFSAPNFSSKSVGSSRSF